VNGATGPRPSPRLDLRLPADPAATEALGQRLGARLRAGAVLGLVGDLGAGKTTLVRGLARGLGIDDPDAVASPTYLLVVEHPGPVPLLHADAYLPAKLRGFLDDGGLDWLLGAPGVAVVEWADRIADLLPPATLWLHLDPLAGGGRRVRIHCADATGFPWLADGP
jgi:tRNA threonylcarbamoyladenosine biosynthesis protein TsaE